MRTLALATLLVVAFATPAAADDGDLRLRRTTPRATFEEQGGALRLGVPGGRAWGIESRLLPLPANGTVVARLEVRDAAVREAFVRVAYYASLRGRPRQIEIADSEFASVEGQRVLIVRLDPPPDAVAYRLRILARLEGGTDRSRADAIDARIARPQAGRAGTMLSRLMADGP
jgi:hypothetical protein